MKKFDGVIFDAYSLLMSVRSTWQRQPIVAQVIVPDAFSIVQSKAQVLAATLHDVELDVFANAADGLIRELDKAETLANGSRRLAGQNLGSALTHLQILGDYLGLEMANRYLLLMPSSKVKYYKEPKLFGDIVFTQFPSDVALEIEEAGKCFALNRYTASVFHLMRVLEVGIRAISKSLAIPDPIKDADRNWARMLKKIKDEIERRSIQKPSVWKSPEDKDFFDEVYVSLDAVRNVWRNATMHVEKTYGEEQAEHIFMAVRGFMNKLANRIDEQGLPLA